MWLAFGLLRAAAHLALAAFWLAASCASARRGPGRRLGRRPEGRGRGRAGGGAKARPARRPAGPSPLDAF